MKNKKKIILFVIILIVIIPVLVLIIIFPHRSYPNDIIIESSSVNNFYNNSVANKTTDATQIGDTILYNYTEDVIDYGTFAITTGNTKRVYWNGLQFYPSVPSLDILYHNKVLKNSNSDDFFDIKKGEFVSTETQYSPDKHEAFYCFIKDNCRYFVSSDNKYYQQQGDEYKMIADISSASTDLSKSSSYITNEYIYYSDYANEQFWLCQYKRKSESIKKLRFEEGDVVVDSESLLANDEKLIFLSMDYDTLYVADFNTNRIDKLYHVDEGVMTVNLYKNSIYIGVRAAKEEGLLEVPVDNTDSIRWLSRKKIYGVYIFDNNYVYYQDENKNFYRVTTDGKRTDNIFVR